MAVTAGEKVLAAEWMAVMAVLTGDALGESGGGTFSLPQPSRYFATVIVYLMLAGLALVNDRTAKLASSLGGLAALVILIAPPDPTKLPSAGNRPLIYRFFRWIAAMERYGPTGTTPPAATAPAGGGSNPLGSPSGIAGIVRTAEGALGSPSGIAGIVRTAEGALGSAGYRAINQQAAATTPQI